MMDKQKIVRNFLVLEGIDGAGTTTQGNLLHERCRREGIPAILTQEPTRDPVGRFIRSILRKETTVTPETMAHLFAADRNEHIFGPDGILSTVERGLTVISDRYFFSSLAYQTVDCDADFVRGLNSRFPLPEMLVYLEVAPEIGEKRLNSRSEREIYEYLDFQNRATQNYARLWEEYAPSSMRIMKIDGTLDPGVIHDRIWSFFKNFRY